MDGLITNIQRALDYIEENLTGDIDVRDVAAQAYLSPFYFQRIFGVLCGMTVGEYIRKRRLTLAAQELSLSGTKVIDAAMKYGYDSPDSFARAFSKFHGISPSAAMLRGARLKSIAPMHIKIILEGGTDMEFKIVEKAAFTVLGKMRRFSSETSYREIPKFWLEHLSSADANRLKGMYGVCLDGGGQDFEYMIADNYVPWEEIPDGYAARTIPAGTWAVFPCRGALPDALQKVNTAIWNEWLPACREYALAGDYNIEMYAPPAEKNEDNYSEIWVPVKKANPS